MKKSEKNKNLTSAPESSEATDKQSPHCLHSNASTEAETKVYDKHGKTIHAESTSPSGGELREVQPDEVDAIPEVEKDLPEIDGYTIVSELGSGGMGKVYKALQVSMDRMVALKVLPSRYADNDRFIQRFLREAKAAGRLNHPNIVQGIDVGECNDVYYFAMEFVDGQSMEKVLYQRGKIDEQSALKIIYDISQALIQAEEAGIVHRDIKPDNIFVNQKGLAKLGDLGLAKSMEERQDVTMQGAVIGTPFYMSPEQCRGEDRLDTRSDIYSLGITLFHFLTGQLPFRGSSVAVTLAKHLNDEAPKVTELVPEISLDTERLLTNMLAKSPEDRYPNATDLNKDIQSIMAGRPVNAQSLTKVVHRQDMLDYKYSRVLSDEEVMFSMISLKSKLITPMQLKECLDIQEKAAKDGIDEQLGNILVERGYLSINQVKAVLRTQMQHQRELDHKTFGFMIVDKGYATQAQVQAALDEQEELYQQGKPSVLGNLMLQMAYITQEQKNEVLQLQEFQRASKEDLSFGKIVHSLGLIGTRALNRCIKIQQKRSAQGDKIRLFDLLIAEGEITVKERDVILRSMKRMMLTGQSMSDLMVEQQAGDPIKNPSSLSEKDTVLFSDDDFVVNRIKAEECPFCGKRLTGEPDHCPKCRKSLH